MSRRPDQIDFLLNEIEIREKELKRVRQRIVELAKREFDSIQAEELNDRKEDLEEEIIELRERLAEILGDT